MPAGLPDFKNLTHQLFERFDMNAVERTALEELFDYEIVLSANHVHSVLDHLSGAPQWTSALPELMTEFTALLCDACDLTWEFTEPDDPPDMSTAHHPSIRQHPQNRKFHDWTALIELSRDSWLATSKTNPGRARLVAESWWQIPHPVFKRLALFAAAHLDVVPCHVALEWLLAEECWWLWARNTKREVMQLLAALVPRIDAVALGQLVQAILAGPPPAMLPENQERFVDRQTWLRLARLNAAGAPLGVAAQQRLDQLSARYPTWPTAPEERDEHRCSGQDHSRDS